MNLPLIIRWQMGDYGDLSWDALDCSVRLMQRLEPLAECHIIHQGEIRRLIPNVAYHKQDGRRLEGHYYPARISLFAQEVWFDNDHIMWALPEGWKAWRKREDAVLIWKVDWDYYGWYADKFSSPFSISSGMWGLPPGMIIPPAIWPDSPEGDDMGWIALHLAGYPNHESVTIGEVNCYQPGHVVLGEKWNHFGTHGVHLVGMNRGWNGNAEEAIANIRKEWGL